MQILITQGALARSRVLQINGWQVGAVLAGLLLAMLLLSGAVYHYFFLKAAREGWPVVSQLVKLVVRDEFAQRDRVMRENLDALAVRVGDMQARMVKLEAMGDRVSGLAGLKADDLKALRPGTAPAGNANGIQGAAGGSTARPAPAQPRTGAGGPYLPMSRPALPAGPLSLEQLAEALTGMEESADAQTDWFTLIESRLLESRLRTLMIPSTRPVDGPVGSGFGFRPDPITGRGALHTGLDFPSDIGTPIHAAAGGVVRSAEQHPQYGNLLEIDHGNGLTTRYGHTSRILVKVGDLVKRGQLVANVGNSGRSTGPHLHFEVLVDDVPQDPSKFLAGVAALPANVARAPVGQAPAPRPTLPAPTAPPAAVPQAR